MRQAVLERHNKNTQSPSSRTRTQRGWAELSDAEMSQTLGPLLDIQKPRSPHHVIVDTLSCSAIFHKVCGDHHTVTGIPNRGEQKNIPSVSCKSPLCSDDKHPTLDTLDAIAIHGGFGDGQLGVRGHGIGPVVAIVKFFRVHADKTILIAMVQIRSHHLPCSLVLGHAFDLEGADQHLHLVRRLHRNVHPRL